MASRHGHLAGAAQSLRGRVFVVVRVRLFSFLPRGISRLTLEMTACSIGWRRGEGVADVSLPGDCHVARCAPRNDRAVRVCVWFYIVISTEVRVLTRTQWINPLRLSRDYSTTIIVSTYLRVAGPGTAARWRAATGKCLLPCFFKRSLYHLPKYLTAGNPRTDGFFATFFST